MKVNRNSDKAVNQQKYLLILPFDTLTPLLKNLCVAMCVYTHTHTHTHRYT